jgi:endonuclease/exonuclease/phosphatase family metal-dependent hydrolase
MSPARARPLRARTLFAVGSVLVASLPGCVAADEGPPGGADPQITVMTQNLYLGTPLNDAFGASSWPELVDAGSAAWARLLEDDFPTRAGALAEEIARERPDVIGLQEVALWRDQTPGDVRTRHVPNATHVAFDFLVILEEELRARGVPYTAVATSTNVDVEFPRSGPGGGLVDLRLTDRGAIMVRSDVAEGSSNPMHGRYTAQLVEPFPTGPVESTRSWTSIDHRLDPTTTVRIVNTHLEVGGPGVGTIQEDQADELVAMIAASPHPVIALGDFNSPPDASPTYRGLTAVLHDAWTSARPADPGWTCCQTQPLTDAVGRAQVRVDLVLTSEDWPVTRVRRTVDQPFRAVPPPLWASDHSGVTARIVVSGQ